MLDQRVVAFRRLDRRALRLRRRHDTPESVAISEYNLANAYGRRLRGDPSASAERAVRLYERALRVRTREGSTREWRWTMHNLAVAWRTRPGGDPSANADRAIALGACDIKGAAAAILLGAGTAMSPFDLFLASVATAGPDFMASVVELCAALARRMKGPLAS